MPAIGNEVTIRVTQAKIRKKNVRIWGGYGMANGLDRRIRYDLEEVLGFTEEARKAFKKIRVGTLITGILVEDSRYERIVGGRVNYLKLRDINIIARCDGEIIFSSLMGTNREQ